MPTIGAPKTTGIREFQASIQQMDAGLDGMIKETLAEAAELVAADARRKIPTLTGAARNSLKVVGAMVTAGGSKAPYYPWLDYGGRAGRRGARRPWRAGGRYIWKSYGDLFPAIQRVSEKALDALTRRCGLDVS